MITISVTINVLKLFHSHLFTTNIKSEANNKKQDAQPHRRYKHLQW